MEYTAYEVALDCVVSLEKKKKSYMITTLFHDHVSAAEKHTTDLDAKGSAYLKFKDVNMETDFLRFQIINQSRFFDDKQVGNLYVRVSDLMSSSISSDRQVNKVGLEKYEFGKMKSKKYKGNLKLWYKLSKTQENKADVESKHVPAAIIGNDMVSSLRAPLLSINWRS